MSLYSRFGSDSDVFIYVDEKVGTVCFSCPFDDAEVDPRSRTLHNHEELLEHMEEHVLAGHKVPRTAIEQVKSEMDSEA